jgi:hypothetical protein
MVRMRWIAVVALAVVVRPAVADGGRRLTKAEFGEKWPLSVDEGVVRCLAMSVVVFEANGKTYAVNGTAKGLAKERGFLSIDSIWLEDPKFTEMAKEIAASQGRPLVDVMKEMGPPSRINIGPILDSGIALCG